MTVPLHNNTVFIDGEFVPSAADGRIDVINPANRSVLGSIPAGSPLDVERAVAAARRAFPSWAATDYGTRAAICQRVIKIADQRSEEVAQLITKEMGSPIAFSRFVQAGSVGVDFGFTLATAPALSMEEWVLDGTLVVREPVGVVAGITPWNFPLHQVALKVAPALLAGCTFVLKPSELAPLSSYLFAEILRDAGVPPGVFNLVQGDAARCGQALVAHPDVDLVTFTGSHNAGVAIGIESAKHVRKLVLELGGKSAGIFLDDVDVQAAVAEELRSCFGNGGQVCAALTRLLVPRALLKDVEDALVSAVPAWAPGDPMNPDTLLGPLVSGRQRQRVTGFIDRAVQAGATLLAGGSGYPAGFEGGEYVLPTVFTDVTPDMEIAREEVFGPVLAVLPYEDEADALAIANDSRFGLSGGVWSADVDRALRFARRIRTGGVRINGAQVTLAGPFGGVGASGVGREGGVHGYAEYFELKAITGLARASREG